MPEGAHGEGAHGAEAWDPGTGMQGGAHPCTAPCSRVVTEWKEKAVVVTLPGPRG